MSIKYFVAREVETAGMDRRMTLSSNFATNFKIFNRTKNNVQRKKSYQVSRTVATHVFRSKLTATVAFGRTTLLGLRHHR